MAATNAAKLVSVFSSSLNIDEEQVQEDLTYNSIPQWDSVAHMILIAAIEAEFDVMLEMDDIIDMSSVGVSKSILRKHGIEI